MNTLLLKYRSLVLGLPLLLASCFAARDYERPEVVDESQYRSDALPQDSLPIAGIPWMDFFVDTLLQGHIQKGLENNIDIRVAVEQILAAEAYLRQGRAGYFPTLSLNAIHSRQRLSRNSQFGAQFSSLNQTQITAQSSWEADIWGKITSNKNALRAAYLQSVSAHQAVKSRLVADISATYYQLLTLDEQLQVTEETVETRESSLETTSALKQAGSVTEVAVKQTEAQLYTAQALAIDIRNQIRLLENTMSILLGEAPKEIPRGDLEAQKIDTTLRAGVPIQLLQNRPDVMAAEYGLVNAFQLTNVARSNFYPSLTLTGTAGLQSLDFAKLFDSSSFFTSLVTGLTQPVFNGRRLRSEYEAARTRQEQAKLRFEYAVINASREVSDALYSYEAAVDKIAVKQKEYDAYTLATEYSEELLDNGLVNYLEVLRARENQLNTQLDLIATRNSQLQAVVDLYYALGGGWR